jgi:hypothetical protein
MSKSRIVLLVGALFTLLGAVLRVEAGSLAARWLFPTTSRPDE